MKVSSFEAAHSLGKRSALDEGGGSTTGTSTDIRIGNLVFHDRIVTLLIVFGFDHEKGDLPFELRRMDWRGRRWSWNV